VVSFTARPLYPRGKKPVSIGLVGLRAGLDAEENKTNVLPLPRIEPAFLLVTRTVSVKPKLKICATPHKYGIRIAQSL
jgi:hypothetical protein